MDESFGEGGVIKFNYSKHKRNQYATEQVLLLIFPLEFLNLIYSTKNIDYDGGFYKGYYRLRGVELFNFRINLKNPIEAGKSALLVDEMNKLNKFIEGLKKIESEASYLETKDSDFENLENSVNWIDFSEIIYSK